MLKNSKKKKNCTLSSLQITNLPNISFSKKKSSPTVLLHFFSSF